MKKLLLLLLCVFVLSCSENKETEAETEVQPIVAIQYGINIKTVSGNFAFGEYKYRFYQYHNGETYHEGVTSGSLFFKVTSKEIEAGDLLVDIEKVEGNSEHFNVYVVVRNSDGAFLNIEDNPEAASLFELNPVVLADGIFKEGIIRFKGYDDEWLKRFNNN